ncbi:MAG: hypothetical protein HY010_23355 [Acidobacteria bacterium]|nr:hypothetical protein [Acidobacteriota bacterium]
MRFLVRGGLVNEQRRYLLSVGLAFIFLVSLVAFGQTDNSTATTPLGDIVKKNKQAGTPKAKVVVNDDNLTSHRGPIPAISLEGVDNSDEIVHAIQEFKKTHTPAETEETMRLWYDEFDTMMADVLDDNNRLVKRKEDRALNEATGSYYGTDGDYERAMRRRNSAIAEDRSDFRRERKNGMMMARIQQTFMKVRNAMQSIGLRYEWFKIRNGNGNGSF